MYRQTPRIPSSCPEGFKGRYTVSPGDTMYTLSQIFRTRLEALAVNNPHIPNPNILIPGDVLCVPALIPIPCCVTLNKQGRVPFGTGGAAYATFGPRGGQAISVAATLPPPGTFGNYDIYIVTAFFKDIGGFGNELFPTREDPPTWASRIDFPTVVSLSSDTEIAVQPSNSRTGIDGPVILSGSLGNCTGCTGQTPPSTDGICRVILSSTAASPGSTGLATLRLEPARAVIAAMELPDPRSFGSRFARYRAWVIDTQTQSRFRIDLRKAFDGTWIGAGEGGSLRNFDEIIVTPEPERGASSPTGPVVLRGSLGGC